MNLFNFACARVNTNIESYWYTSEKLINIKDDKPICGKTVWVHTFSGIKSMGAYNPRLKLWVTLDGNFNEDAVSHWSKYYPGTE